MASELETIVNEVNSKFASLGQDWIEGVIVNDRVKIGVTQAARAAWKEDKNRQPANEEKFALVQQLTQYLNEVLSKHPNHTWVTCGVDSELYFTSKGRSSVQTASSSSSSSSSSSNKPVLRYWASRGRAQGLRYLLSDVLGVEGWVEDEVTFDRAAEWKATLKQDVSFAGPWHTLPAFKADSTASTHLVNQTEAIARYLAAKYNVGGANLDEQTAADGILCATYQTVTTNSMKALYAADEAAVLKEIATMKETYVPYLAVLVDLLGEKNYLLSNDKPLYCDYFVLDALQHVRAFLGLSFIPPALLKYLERFEARPNIAAEIARAKPRWCYAPTEPANWDIVRAQLQN